jgi:diguanylate cyclase (GGDEF)-like protein
MLHSLSRSQREKSKSAVLFLDLDDFKIINDTKGHDIGDEILKSVANRLSGCLRKSDILARIGGDEFIILLENIEDINQVKQAAEKILTCFRESYTINDLNFDLSTSIGISLYPENGQDAETLIKNADLALYQAKEIGKSQYAFYTSASNNDGTKT